MQPQHDAPPATAVILVGGPSRGTRFRPLALHCPKPLFPVGGTPLLYHHLAALADVPGLRDVHLVGFFDDAVFAPFLARVATDFPALRVRYLREATPLGTAGGLFHFRDELLQGNPALVYVLHSDVCTGASLAAMRRFHAAHRGLGTVLATRVPAAAATHRYGAMVVDPEGGEVVHYVEKPEFYISDLINAGVYLFDAPRIFAVLESIRTAKVRAAEAAAMEEMQSRSGDLLSSMDSLQVGAAAPPSSDDAQPDHHHNQIKLRLEQDVLRELAGTHELFAYETHEFWTQMKTAASAVHTNALVLQHNKQHRRRSMAMMPDGPNIVGAVAVHATAQVHPTAKIGPNVSIGPGVVVGPGVRIRDAIVLDNAEIRANACILHAVIGWDARVGTWTRVEGTPSAGDDPAAANTGKLMVGGIKAQTATVIGHQVSIADEVIIRNCIVLPHKELKSSYHNDILM